MIRKKSKAERQKMLRRRTCRLDSNVTMIAGKRKIYLRDILTFSGVTVSTKLLVNALRNRGLITRKGTFSVNT